MAKTGWELVTDFSEHFPDGLGSVLVGGIGGVLGALYIGVADIAIEATDLFEDPLGALGQGSANIIASFSGGIANIITTGAETTQQSLLPGQPWAVGPLTFAFAVGAGGVGLYVMAAILSTQATSDLLPGTFSDVPFLGADEEEGS